MRFFSIIPDQVLHKFRVKRIQVVQVIDKAADELVLNGLIESFQMGVGLRVFRIIEEVNEVVLTAELIEVFMEFASIVGLDSGGREGSDSDELIEEVAAVG